MKYSVFGVVMGMMLITSQAQAATVDMASITLRMQAIITQMQELQREFASLQLQAATSVSTPVTNSSPAVSQVLGAATDNLQEVVVYDATNDTIAKVQRLLATDVSIYPYGAATGFFGPKTEESLKNLQGRYGMKQVGVVGPETAALLMSYFTAYPGENYPADVLKTRPAAPAAVLGVSTSNVSPAPAPSTPVVTTSNPLESIFLKKDDGEIVIRVVFKNGNAVGTVAASADENDIVKAITKKTGLSSAVVSAVLDMSQLKGSSSGDKGEASDMLDEAEEAIDEAEEAIDEADEDGDDVDDVEDLLDEAEDVYDDAWDAFDDRDYEEAYDLAKKARNLAKDAEDEL